MTMKTLQDLFIHNLSDLYNAEKQLAKALPKLAKSASHDELTELFQSQLEETQNSIEQLDRVVEQSGVKLKRIKCAAIEGLLEEAKEVLDDGGEGPVRDAALVAAVQKIVHYEIAAMGTLSAFATHLGFSEGATTLREALDDKKARDENFTSFAEESINPEALHAQNARSREAQTH